MFSGSSSLVIQKVEVDSGTIVVRASMPPGPVACPQDQPTTLEAKRAATTRERWRQVHHLLDRGVGLLEISRRLNLALNTVKRYARINQPERLVRAPQYRPTLVDPFRDHLRRRREEDPAVLVLQLLHEITELGYTGSQNLLHRYITQGRVESDRPAISPRRLTRYLLTHPDTLHGHQRERIDAATSACSEMTGPTALIHDFAALLTPAPGNDECLTSWIDQARRMVVRVVLGEYHLKSERQCSWL